MNEKFTVALIGCGAIAKNSHLPAFEKLGCIRVKYACDLIPEKAYALKESYPFIENVITDYKIALADEEVEAVFVLTHNRDHYQHTVDALRAGKHVLCEKPICVNYEMSLEMKREADEQGKMLNIGVVNRYGNAANILRDMVREGKLGKIYTILCNFRAPLHMIPGIGGPFTSKYESGGGALIDTGIHYLDIIEYIMGGLKYKKASCDIFGEIGKDMKAYRTTFSMWSEDTANVEDGVYDVEGYVSGYIRAEGVSLSLNGGWAQNLDISDRYIDFLGTEGGARFDYSKKTLFFTDAKTQESKDLTPPRNNFFIAQTEAFIDSIRTGVKARTNIDYVLPVMKLIDALYESAECGREVEIKE